MPKWSVVRIDERPIIGLTNITRYILVNWFRQKPQQSQSLIRNGGGSGESLPISGSMISLARPPHMPAPHTSRPVHVKRRVGYTLNR